MYQYKYFVKENMCTFSEFNARLVYCHPDSSTDFHWILSGCSHQSFWMSLKKGLDQTKTCNLVSAIITFDNPSEIEIISMSEYFYLSEALGH